MGVRQSRSPHFLSENCAACCARADRMELEPKRKRLKRVLRAPAWNTASATRNMTPLKPSTKPMPCQPMAASLATVAL